MAPNRSVRLSKAQALHERVMRAVALRMRNTPYVLKGGTALALVYGLDRHSVDLDFDGGRRISIKRHVQYGLRDANVSMAAFIPDYDTWKGQRFKVHYVDPQYGKDRLMKVEVSFRQEPTVGDIAIVDGIRTYKAPALFDQKLKAAGARTKARDLFDLGFLAASYGDKISTEQLQRADEFSRDYEAIADTYRGAFQADRILAKLTTADDRALFFRIAIVEQMHRRGLAIAEQALPTKRSLADVLAAHKIWLESEGDEGYRADLSDRKFTGAVLCGVSFEKTDLCRADFTGADLRNANLRNANLREAVFDGTDLSGADFCGADLTGLTLRRSMLGPTTKGFAEALEKVSKRDPSHSVRYRPVVRRTVLERDSGPSR